MADVRIRNAFGFSIASLQLYCSRFDSALEDEAVGPDVRRHLPADLPAKFKALRNRLAELAVLQAATHGRAGELTLDKRDKLGEVVLLSGSARRAARAVYARVPAVLHGEFFVGGHRSKSVATVLANAEKLVENCVTHAEALAPHGWSAEETALLAAAVDALRLADVEREAATDRKEGHTAEQTTVANELYRMCRAIQNVARVVYAKSKIEKDATLVTGRAKFMLGEFPPRPGAALTPGEGDSAGPISPTPANAQESPTSSPPSGAESIPTTPVPPSDVPVPASSVAPPSLAPVAPSAPPIAASNGLGLHERFVTEIT